MCEELLPCPVCGAKAYCSESIADGFYYGWSVGCPRFHVNDGIHGVDENSPKKMYLSIHYLKSKEECIKRWNERVQNYGK